MSIEQSVSSKSIRSQNFHEIFQRALSHKSGSRPPKIELTGILVPLEKKFRKPDCNFRLETDQNECVLRMSDAVSMIAYKLQWEEVTVKGYLDADEGIFEVERISLSKSSEPYRLSLGPADFYLELDQYKKSIAHKGVVEVAPEHLLF